MIQLDYLSKHLPVVVDNILYFLKISRNYDAHKGLSPCLHGIKVINVLHISGRYVSLNPFL
jgi:hypothetical protein